MATRQDERIRRVNLQNVPLLDAGARGSTITFAQRGIGDVLIAREMRLFSIEEFGKDNFESSRLRSRFTQRAARRGRRRQRRRQGTRKLAEAYLNFLSTPAAQTIIAKITTGLLILNS